MSEKSEIYLHDWKEREALAEKMLPLIGRLYREKNIVCTIYGRNLIGRTVIDILKAHRFVRQVEQNELSVKDSLPIVESLLAIDTVPSRIDIGKLAIKYQNKVQDIKEFLKNEIIEVLNVSPKAEVEPVDVILYGFGRIGRLVARLLIERASEIYPLKLKAVVVRKGGENDLLKRASLLRRDSVHGPFQGTIKIDEEENALIANGNMIKVLYSDSPDSIDYTQYGIKNAIVIDNTGKWRDEAGLGLHLKSKGVNKVLLTAPGKGDIKNIVHGVNDNAVTPEDNIISAASCTTNAIVPVLKAVNDEYGIKSGHIETVHSYTNDQNLIDNYHKGDRRGRSAVLNMVLTETGAAKAVNKVLPELAGILTANAIRVPTPDVSMAILHLNLGKKTNLEELNNYLRYVSLHSPLQKQIDYSNSPDAVSTDFVGSRFACVIDAKSTIVKEDSCVLYVWYDNEFGYSCQVMRLMQKATGVHYPTIPLS